MNKIKLDSDVYSLLYGTKTSKKDKILMKMYNVNNEIQSITHRGATWKVDLNTGDYVFIGRKLSKEESQKVEELKAELKKLEVELKIADLEKDFEDNDKENG